MAALRSTAVGIETHERQSPRVQPWGVAIATL